MIEILSVITFALLIIFYIKSAIENIVLTSKVKYYETKMDSRGIEDSVRNLKFLDIFNL